MTVVQISWCDSEPDVRRNYPSAFDGIAERFETVQAVSDATEIRVTRRNRTCPDCHLIESSIELTRRSISSLEC